MSQADFVRRPLPSLSLGFHTAAKVPAQWRGVPPVRQPVGTPPLLREPPAARVWRPAPGCWVSGGFKTPCSASGTS